MPISLTCKCGHVYRVTDDLAGRKVRCKDCGKILTVPRPASSKNIEDEAANILLGDTSNEADEPFEQSVQTNPPPPPPADPPPVDVLESRPIYRKPSAPAKPAPKPRSKPAERRRGPRIAFEEGWFGSLNAGMIGGLLTMLFSAGLFVLGLLAGRLFIFAPIIFLVGLGALARGFMNRE